MAAGVALGGAEVGGGVAGTEAAAIGCVLAEPAVKYPATNPRTEQRNPIASTLELVQDERLERVVWVEGVMIFETPVGLSFA